MEYKAGNEVVLSKDVMIGMCRLADVNTKFIVTENVYATAGEMECVEVGYTDVYGDKCVVRVNPKFVKKGNR